MAKRKKSLTHTESTRRGKKQIKINDTVYIYIYNACVVRGKNDGKKHRLALTVDRLRKRKEKIPRKNRTSKTEGKSYRRTYARVADGEDVTATVVRTYVYSYTYKRTRRR